MNGNNTNGRVFSCGAASFAMDHQPGQPTAYDRFAAAIKNLLSPKAAQPEATTQPTIRHAKAKRPFAKQNRAA